MAGARSMPYVRQQTDARGVRVQAPGLHQESRMNTGRNRLSRPARAVLLLGAVLACASAGAADKTGVTDTQIRYQLERSMCMNGRTNQDRTTCLQEAGAAYAEAKRDGLGDGAAPCARNASQRCNRLPDEDRRDC